MKTIALALVGLGKIAADQHLPAIAKSPNFRLAGVVTLGEPPKLEIPRFTTQAELFKALPEVEAVAICTPPGARFELVREALEARRHVLMEKPPAATLSEAEDLIIAAQIAHRSLFATWHSRYNLAVDTARDLLAARPPKTVSITWKEDVRRWHPGQDWIFAEGGFGVFDPGINALSVLTKILPVPVFVRKAELVIPANRATPIAAALEFAAPSGSGLAQVSADFDFLQEGEQTWTIEVATQDGGNITLTHGGTRLFIDGQPKTIEADQEYPAIYQRFAELIETSSSDIDLRPLRLVADAFMLGRRTETNAFNW